MILWLLCGSLLGHCDEGQGRTIRFAGEVARGLAFRKDIGHGLDFVLKPISENLPPELTGWTIEVMPRGRPADSDCRDFVWVATPPYRFWNPRYLSTEYGYAAQEAVAMSPREFNFVLSCDDYKTESQRVERVLWPSTYCKQEVDESLAKLGTSPLGSGRLSIKDSEITPGETTPDGKKLGAIQWIKFEVEINFPEGLAKNRKP